MPENLLSSAGEGGGMTFHDGCVDCTLGIQSLQYSTVAGEKLEKLLPPSPIDAKNSIIGRV